MTIHPIHNILKYMELEVFVVTYVKHCDAYTEYQTTIDRIETMNCQIVGGLQEVNNKRTEENTEVIN